MDGMAGAVVRAEFDEQQEHFEATHQGGFMFIGELATETGIDPKTIRFYEREGLLSPPRHGRFRTYMSSDVNRLKDVLTLRRLGIGIAQIRALLANGADLMNNAQSTNVLLNHLETLRTRQAEVARQIEETASIVVRLTKDSGHAIPLAMGAMALISSHMSNWSSSLPV
jgi:MerR family transcriptional regulator, copper efflux regulator